MTAPALRPHWTVGGAVALTGVAAGLRPTVVVGLTLASAIVQTFGAAVANLPPVSRPGAEYISVRTRKVVLTVHIVSSVAWLGIITVQAVLAGVAVMLIAVTAHKPALEAGYAQVLQGRTATEINESLWFVGLLPTLGLSPLMSFIATVLSVYKPRGLTRYAKRAG